MSKKVKKKKKGCMHAENHEKNAGCMFIRGKILLQAITYLIYHNITISGDGY